MRLSVVVVSLACVAGGATLAAPLQHPFTPANTNFTASGKITLTTPQGTATCQQSIKGATGKNGMAHVTSVVYSGADTACAATRAAGLPWKVMPTSANTGKIVAMEVTSGSATCGPSLVHLSLRSNGVWSYSGATMTSCTASAMIHTTPPITPAP